MDAAFCGKWLAAVAATERQGWSSVLQRAVTAVRIQRFGIWGYSPSPSPDYNCTSPNLQKCTLAGAFFFQFCVYAVTFFEKKYPTYDLTPT